MNSIYFCAKTALAFAFVLMSMQTAFSADSKDCENSLEKNILVKINPTTFEYSGLTAAGLAELKVARDAIRSRDRLFENEFRQLSAVHHAWNVSRLAKTNIYLSGGPGGAKSSMMDWFILGENKPAFQLQMHPMTSERAIIGGESFEAAKDGRFEINTAGSMGDFEVALLDEAHVASPPTLTSMLGLLAERKIRTGKEVVLSPLETVAATGNAIIPEIIAHFLDSGQGPTGPAFLNRFQIKCLVHNWLDVRDQAHLDERRAKKTYLANIAKMYPQVLKNEVFLTPEKVNWEVLRKIGKAAFIPDALFMATYRELANQRREEIFKVIRESEKKVRDNDPTEPYVYLPSEDPTERLRQQIPDMVVYSAFIDFLRSPLADDDVLETNLAKKVNLDPVSLWRVYLVGTTIGPGETRFVFQPDADQKFVIDFGQKIDPSTAKDEREERNLKNMNEERDRFVDLFVTSIKGLQHEFEKRSRFHISTGAKTLEGESFEIKLSRSLQGK